MDRSLAAFETAVCITDEFSPFNVVVALRLVRGPSTAALRRSLNHLVRWHPMLSVAITGDGRKRRFVTRPEPSIQPATVERRGAEHWREVVETELNRRLDVEVAPLMRCCYLVPREDEASEIVLTFHHAVMDGSSAVVLLDQLLTLCDSAADASSIQPYEAAPPAEDLFPAKMRGLGGAPRIAGFMARQMADELSYRLRSRGSRRPPVHDTARNYIQPVELDENGTAELVRRSRRERVPLNAVVSAAMMRAVGRHLYDDRAVPMRYFSFADLRPYLSPPVPEERLGCYIAPLRFTIGVRPEQPFWEFARDISNQVHAGARRGDKFCSMLTMPTVMRTVVGQRRYRMGTTAVSFSGAANLQTRYGTTEVRELHAFVSNISLGPEYTAQARISAGRLWWDIVYLDVDMESSLAGRIADEIIDVLLGAGGSE